MAMQVRVHECTAKTKLEFDVEDTYRKVKR
jgi:hypothetical protein